MTVRLHIQDWVNLCHILISRESSTQVKKLKPQWVPGCPVAWPYASQEGTSSWLGCLPGLWSCSPLPSGGSWFSLSLTLTHRLHQLTHLRRACCPPQALLALSIALAVHFWLWPFTLLFALCLHVTTEAIRAIPASCPGPSSFFEPGQICPASCHKREIRHPAGERWSLNNNSSKSTFRKCH